MAQTITYTDDMDGSPDAQTIRFALLGSAYEIDLAPKNLEKLQKALQPFIEKSRSPGSAGGGRARRSTGARRGAPPLPPYSRPDFLEWAAKKGYEVPKRGRTKREWIDEYLNEGGK